MGAVSVITAVLMDVMMDVLMEVSTAVRTDVVIDVDTMVESTVLIGVILALYKLMQISGSRGSRMRRFKSDRDEAFLNVRVS